MARGCSWCWVAILLVLLFVTTHGLRESTSRIEGHDSRTTARSRGVSRYNSKPIEGLETSASPFSSSAITIPTRSRNAVRKGGYRFEDPTKSQPDETKTSTRTSSTPIAPTNTDRRRTTSNFAGRKSATKLSQIDNSSGTTETPVAITESSRIGLFRGRSSGGSRRGSTIATIERSTTASSKESTNDRSPDPTGPSVFSGTTEVPRSRTGRKIQTTLSSKSLKVGLPSSRRYTSSRKFSDRSNDARSAERRSDDGSSKRKQDIVSSGSETISIDVPLISDDPGSKLSIDDSAFTTPPRFSETTTKISLQRKITTDEPNRTRTRGRSNDVNGSNIVSESRSGSGRGNSRFPAVKSVDNSLEKTFGSRNDAGRSGNSEKRIKSGERSSGSIRTRGRINQEAGNKISKIPSRSETPKKSEHDKLPARGRTTESKVKALNEKSSFDEDRARSRSRSREIESNVVSPITTSTLPETTESPATSKVTTSSAQTVVTSARTPKTRTTRSQDRTQAAKEDEGSGKRGKITNVDSAVKKSSRNENLNHGRASRGRKHVGEATKDATTRRSALRTDPSVTASPKDDTERLSTRKSSYHQSVIATTSLPDVTTAGIRTIAVNNEISTSNEIVQTTRSSVDGDKTNRGNKRPVRFGNEGAEFGTGGRNTKKTSGRNKVKSDLEEGDNYPPAFKAKLAQLKNVEGAGPRSGSGEHLESIPTRHSRSTSVPSESESSIDDERVTISELPITTIITIIPITETPLSSTPSVTDQPNTITKKRPSTDPQFVSRSRQKLEIAKKSILQSESNDNSNDDPINDGEKKITTSSTVVHEKNRKNDEKPNKSISTTTNSEQRKSSNFAKRFGPTNNHSRSTQTNKSVRSSTGSRNENKSSKIAITNRSIVDITTKSSILSRKAKELPRDSIPTTTQRSRSWKSKHIDKNFRTESPINEKFNETPGTFISSTTTKRSRVWNTPYIDRDWQEPSTTLRTVSSSSTMKNSRPRNLFAKSVNRQQSKIDTTTRVTDPTTISDDRQYSKTTSRTTVESSTTMDKNVKLPVTEKSVRTSHRESRPRTATYRRHSEQPKVIVVNAIPIGKTSTSTTTNSIAITPKAPARFHATVKSSDDDEITSQRSARQEPTVNVKISDDNEKSKNIVDANLGIVGASNGASGSNIFSPTRSTKILKGNSTLFEQLRSTVAPLLNALGNRTPIFSTGDVANNSNSGARITPSGSPPRFSARYKGAELFVRRPNVLEPAGPFLSSSTTPSTPIENSGSAPPITIDSPGEPKVITFYRSLETASITNEISQTDDKQQQRQQIGSDAQVDARTATDNDSNATNNSNNDTVATTLPFDLETINATTSITTDVSSITTIDNNPQPLDIDDRQNATTTTPTNDTTNDVTLTDENTDTTVDSTLTNETTSTRSTVTPDQASETIPEGSPPSTLLDTTTVTSTSLESMTTDSGSTLMSTEDTVIPQDSGIPSTTIPSLVGRIIYSERETNSTTTEETVDTTTSALVSTTVTDSETSVALNMIDASLVTDSAVTEMDMANTSQPILAVTSTTMTVTTGSPNGLAEEPETADQVTSTFETTMAGTVTVDASNTTLEADSSTTPIVPQTTSDETKNTTEIVSSGTTTLEPDKSTLEVVFQTVTTSPETMTPAETTPVMETRMPETATTSVGNSTLEIVVQTATSLPDTTTTIGVTSTFETSSPETTPTSDGDSTTGSNVETVTPTLETTTATPMNEGVTIPESTTSTMTEQDFTTTSRVTNNDTVTESIPSVITTTNETDITTRFPDSSTTPESSTRGQSMLEMIRSRIGNDTDIPDFSGDNLMSRMMMRLMMTLFSDSSEETGSSSNTSNSLVDETTRQSPEPSNNTQATTSNSLEEVPQLIGGFLDNTDGNLTSDDSSVRDVTVSTTVIAETNSSSEQTTVSQPESTTIPIASVMSTSPLDETSLTPSATTESSSDRSETIPGPGQDPTSTPVTSDTNSTTNQPPRTTLTPPGTVESSDKSLTNVSDRSNSMSMENLTIINVTTMGNGRLTTNINVPDITTTPVTSSDPTDENPNSLAGFQDTTTATAQRTAGDDAQATSQPDQTTITDSTAPNNSTTTSSPSSDTILTTTDVPTTVPTTSTASTTIATSTMAQTSTPSFTNPTSMETTIAPTRQTTTSGPEMVSMESTLPTTSQPGDPTSTSEVVAGTDNSTTTTSPNTTSELPVMTTQATTMTTNDTNMTSNDSTTENLNSTVTTMSTTTPIPTTTRYLGRFGGSRMTPAPRFSVSSSTKTPLRDYLVYGIFPNKTIVRKRPEDNLIDARNVDSPYVIFGIFPDGKLVRKFPNGTVIPDPPNNPVEVVFTLSTTTTSTTNRPRPVFIVNKPANPGYYYNENAVNYDNRPASLLDNFGNAPGDYPSQINLGLSGNAISPNGEAPASQSNVNKMTDSSSATRINGLTTDKSNIYFPRPTIATTNVNPQGGRFVQDRERDEASRSREAGGQRSHVYIGQEKFINYWTDGNSPNNNSRLVSVKINSVASAVNEGPASGTGIKSSSFDILPNNESSGVGQVTAAPGFPWKDPLDQIFGITTESSIITASVASNNLEDTNPSRSSIVSPSVNPLAEVFGRPLSGTAGSAVTMASTSTGVPQPTTTTIPTAMSPTTTTAAPPTTTTTTTIAVTKTTTTTTNPPPTTTTATTTTTTTTTELPTTITTTTTMAPTKSTITAATTTAAATSTTVVPTTMADSRQTAFGTTFDDLAFLNSLLQSNSGDPTTPKTLTDVEQLLANKILSLALGNPGPTRSPKSIQPSEASSNSVFSNPSPGPSSRPIIIDLLRSTSTFRPIPTDVITEQTTRRPTTTPSPTTTKMAAVASTATTFATLPTTREPRITKKPMPTNSRPRKVTTTTTAPPLGFGAGILRAIFGQNPFGNAFTTQKPVQNTWKPVRTTVKPVRTSLSPIATTSDQFQVVQSIHVTPRNVRDNNIDSHVVDSLTSGSKHEVTTSTVKTSTYSNDDDAKLLAALLKLADGDGGTGSGGGKGLSAGDEAFLRSLVNERGSKPKPAVTTTTMKTSTYSQEEDAKFLAALLKVAGQGGTKVASGAGVAKGLGLDDEAFIRSLLNEQALTTRPVVTTTTMKTSTYSQEEDAKFLAALLKVAGQGGTKGSGSGASKGLAIDDEAFLRSILNGQASVKPAVADPLGTSDAALLASFLKSQGIEPSTPANRLREQLQSSIGNELQSTTIRPRTFSPTPKKSVPTRPRLQQTTWSPSSTYPPPLFGNFGNFGSAAERPRGENGGGIEAAIGDGSVRNQVFNAAIGATRAFSQFLGAAITGAAQQFQSFVKNGTRYVSQPNGR